MDLINELNNQIQLMEVSVKQLRKNGTALAEAEKNYKMAVCKKALELKDEGMPVTLIQTVIYGYSEIATLRFQRDCAEVVYDANKEALQSIKLRIRVIQKQVDEEWSKNE